MRGVRCLISVTKEWRNLSLLQQSVWKAVSKSKVGGFISRNDSGCSRCSQHTFIVLETKYPTEGGI